MDDDHLIERLVAGETVFRGAFFDVRRDRVLLPTGAEATREYMVHPGAVMVVPIADDGRLVMERQYRHPVQRVMLEFPAGKLDPGEPPFACAVRELIEETGYSAREWARCGLMHTAIGCSTEAIEIWFARGLQCGDANLDAGEHLDVLLIAEDELERGIADGSVTDVKTLVGLLWLKNWRCGRWKIDWRAAF